MRKRCQQKWCRSSAAGATHGFWATYCNEHATERMRPASLKGARVRAQARALANGRANGEQAARPMPASPTLGNVVFQQRDLMVIDQGNRLVPYQVRPLA